MCGSACQTRAEIRAMQMQYQGIVWFIQHGCKDLFDDVCCCVTVFSELRVEPVFMQLFQGADAVIIKNPAGRCPLRLRQSGPSKGGRVHL